MPPGEVKTDEQAFRQILGRLEGDVGTILQLIPEGKKIGLFPDTAPFWALVRMMFPVAESLGDLIYRNPSTVENLQCLLETELEAVRAGYGGKAATLALLFRHSLTHTDELRTLVTNGRKVGWLVGWSEQSIHLNVTNPGPDIYCIHFDTTAFYEDLVAVCHKAISEQWGGKIMQRYNEWLTYDLDKARSTKNIRASISEIRNL
jgi:hypothetical protein